MTETVKPEEKTAPPKVDAEVRALSQHANGLLLKLDALLETVNRMMLILTKSRERASKDFLGYVDSLRQNDPDKKLTLPSDSAEYRCFLKYSKARAKANQASRIVPQSFLVSMVSQYDAFSVATLKSLFLLKPEKIKTADRTISVKELVSFESIQEVLQSLISDEIEDVLRDSHLNQLQWIGKRFDFKIEYSDPLVERFIEITERRNLYVHAEGLVSKQYLNKISGLKSVASNLPAAGEPLLINRHYINEARNTLFELAIRILQLAWRKLRPDHLKEQNHFLIDIVFELLAREDFTLARNISDFASGIRGITDETDRRLMCINRAQAYKWSGKNDEAKKIVDQLDWGASAANFKLAVAVIRDEFESIPQIMQDVPKQGRDGISAEDYRSWPLFRELRTRSDFQSAFKSRFKEELAAKSVDIQEEVELEDAEENLSHNNDEHYDGVKADSSIDAQTAASAQISGLAPNSRSLSTPSARPTRMSDGSKKTTKPSTNASDSASSRAATTKPKPRTLPATPRRAQPHPHEQAETLSLKGTASAVPQIHSSGKGL